MPKAQRERRERTDNYHLILQWCRSPEQRLYEGIRPITLFGIPPAERAEETGVTESTLQRAAAAFDTHGMISLFRPTKAQRDDHHRSLPVPMRQLIVDLKAEYKEGVQGLANRSHVNTSKTGVDLPTRNLIRKKQEENPLLGEFRMYAALKQLGISVPPRTCGSIMAENRQLFVIKPPPKEPHQPKLHPFKAASRHEQWCLDIRYIEKHRIPEIKGSFYVITVMDAFSRVILSGDIFQSQDLAWVLIVLYAAIEQFDAPLRLITDNGGVFRAKQLLTICEALDIEKEYIHASQSWENLVEAHFNIMRWMSQVHFEQVTSWQGVRLAHERFVNDYNTQLHWAHRKRDDHHLSPAEVLGQEKSRLRTPEQLHRIFYATRFLRRLDQLGYTHFRRWKLYGEEGLARHPAVIWLHGDALTVEYEETPLAQ